MIASSQVLHNRYVRFWRDNLYNDDGNPNGNKLRTYRISKISFKFENFLLIDVDKKGLSTFVKIRIINCKSYIENMSLLQHLS